jgi:hypothetical protein
MDGRDTHFYEWRNAELFDAASDQGADHRSVSSMRRVLFGLNEANLFLRVDGLSGKDPGKSSLLLRFTLPRSVEARAPLARGFRGALEWIPGGAAKTPDGEDAGEYAVGDVIEIRVPLARLEATAGSVVHWRVVLEQESQTVEVIPRLGEFATPTLPSDFSAQNWSAT